MPQTSCFNLEFSASPGNVRTALNDLCVFLENNTISENHVGTAQIVAGEVLNNVVEHATRHQADGRIEITCEITFESLIFTVCDNGTPMPPGGIPNKGLPPVDTTLDNLPEGGFGWALVHLLTSGITYHRKQDKNCLKFTLPAIGKSSLSE
nr:ATP-binding protein [uncultured Shimia sp.]